MRCHSTHGTGAHRVPRRGKARSACTRTGGTGRRPVPRCTAHRRYRWCSVPVPGVRASGPYCGAPRTAGTGTDRRCSAHYSRSIYRHSITCRQERCIALRNRIKAHFVDLRYPLSKIMSCTLSITTTQHRGYGQPCCTAKHRAPVVPRGGLYLHRRCQRVVCTLLHLHLGYNS